MYSIIHPPPQNGAVNKQLFKKLVKLLSQFFPVQWNSPAYFIIILDILILTPFLEFPIAENKLKEWLKDLL